MDERNCLRRIARHDERQFSKDSLVHIMEKFVKTVNIMDETILVPCRLMDRQVGDATDIIPAPPKTSSHYSHQHHHHHHSGTGGGGGCRKNRPPQTVHDYLSSADLFNLFNLLNSLKQDLLWTRSDEDSEQANEDENVLGSYPSTATLSDAAIHDSQELSAGRSPMKPQHKRNASNGSTASSSSSASLSSTVPATATKGHIRRPSTASMVSSNSVSNLSDSESEISNENDSGMESEGNCRTGGGSTTSDSSNSTNTTDKATDLVRQCRQHLSGLHRCLEQMTEAANYLTARYQSDIGPV
ncbi:dentin sialophosphoprotein isoform X2 [Hermetia illucens]|uniref:dentin sialophosphoprotein isoform X2 n=1 Tax=Hermetia illucens TaxID=343691 RepID=UPI0018CC5584|nr:dentin sialophosphoprotein isoform X2 [Hermetia illucens]